jgi:hypothetical protein
LEAAVVADAGGWASSAESAALAADPLAWAATLRRLIHETDEGLRRSVGLGGDLREVVLSDLTDERDRLGAVLRRLTGDEIEPPVLDLGPSAEVASRSAAVPSSSPRLPAAVGGAQSTTATAVDAGPPLLQASWAEGRVVVWSGGPGPTPPQKTSTGCSRRPTPPVSHGNDMQPSRSPVGLRPTPVRRR